MRTRLRRVRCFVRGGLKLLGLLDDKRDCCQRQRSTRKSGPAAGCGYCCAIFTMARCRCRAALKEWFRRNSSARLCVPHALPVTAPARHAAAACFAVYCRPRKSDLATAVEGAAERDGFKGQPPSKRGAFNAWGQRHDAGAIKAGLLCSLRRQVGDFQDLPSGLPGGEWANVSSAFKPNGMSDRKSEFRYRMAAAKNAQRK